MKIFLSLPQDNGSVKCWGHNEFGQLGLGDVDNRGDNPYGECSDRSTRENFIMTSDRKLEASERARNEGFTGHET